MGTTLTGTTPQDTYDSLIKVTDNGPLSGSLKVLTDGLGNNSALSLSTGAATITGTLTVSSNLLGQKVQVGTAATLNDPTGVANTLQFANYSPSVFVTGSADSYIYKNSSVFGNLAAQSLVFQTRSDTAGGGFAFVAGGTPAVVATITGAGNVGIGTTAPANKLVVKAAGYGAVASFLDTADNGFVFKADASLGFNAIDQTSQLLLNFSGVEKYRFNTDGKLEVGSGIQFPATQVASANANTLDDYEEGTWTMGVSFGGASVGVAYTVNTGSYVKIGRQVTVNGYLLLTSKGSSTGLVYLTGLPFTVGNTTGNFGAASMWFNNITFASQFQGRINQNQTYIELEEITVLGVASNLTDADFANNSAIMISATYQV